jgi:hypothetical protein
MMKFINMAYYGNQESSYRVMSNKDKRFVKPYLDKFREEYESKGVFGLKELVDTSAMVLRIRTQMLDLGSFEVAEIVDSLNTKIDGILNPDKNELEQIFKRIEASDSKAYEDLASKHKAVLSRLTVELAKGSADLLYELDMNPDLIKGYMDKPEFVPALRAAIDNQYYDFTLTGTSVVAAEGTRYLIENLLVSLLFAIIIISILMAILFRSWRMVLAGCRACIPCELHACYFFCAPGSSCRRYRHPHLAHGGHVGLFHVPPNGYPSITCDQRQPFFTGLSSSQASVHRFGPILT